MSRLRAPPIAVNRKKQQKISEKTDCKIDSKKGYDDEPKKEKRKETDVCSYGSIDECIDNTDTS